MNYQKMVCYVPDFLLPCFWSNYVLDQSQFFQKSYREPGDVEFPPFMSVSSGTLVGVVVVVPAFAIAQQTYEQVIPTVIVRFVVAVTPYVRNRVDTPGDMPGEHRSHKDTPDHEAGTKLDPIHRSSTHRPAD